MYSLNEIQRLQIDNDFYDQENNRYCLVSLQNKTLNDSDLQNQSNFCVLQTIKAYKEKKIDKYQANFILNKIDAIEYSKDMLGIDVVIKKLNVEIIGEELHIPFFNSLCVECDDLYVGFES